MNTKITAALSAIALGLTGCASVSTPMKHADGRVINCSAAGFGWIGAPAALIMRQDCVDKAKAAGFSEIDQPVTPPASASGYSGKVKLALPAGWQRTAAPATATSITLDWARNVTYDGYLQLTYVRRQDIANVDTWANTRRGELLSRLREATSVAPVQTNLNGRNALITDVDGILPANNTRYHFRQTVVEIGDEVYLLAVWAPAAVYIGEAKEQLDAVAQGLGT